MRLFLILSMKVLTSWLPMQSSSPPVHEGQVLSISFRDVALAKGERITGFSIRVVQGHVQAITSIPIDWSLSIAVEPSWQAVASGICHHGASSLTSSTTLPSITVQVLDPNVGPPFSLEAKIDTTMDFQKTNTKQLSISNLIIK